MHQRATGFLATSGSTTLYRTDQWADPPPMFYDPPLDLPAGSPITWACTYVNDTGAPLTFGESAQSNVMCIFSGQYYPVPAGRNPLIACQTL
jgi:hypothetical protein